MLTNLLANIFFPPICLGCRKSIATGVICDTCFNGIDIRTNLICDPDSPYILAAAASYKNETVQALIHNLKFRSIEGAAEPLARLMLRHVAAVKLDLSDFVVVPIPLSRARYRKRGYNQAELIALRIARELALPLETKSLIRTKNIKPQSETKSETERRENIRGVFAVKDLDVVCDKKILLVDDVATSGATFTEASLALKAAGAAEIVALAAAKT